MVDESQATQYVATHNVQLGGEQPVLLHGGALLGVVLNKPASMGERGGAVWDARCCFAGTCEVASFDSVVTTQMGS